MTSFGYIIVDSCIISLNLNCILQLKQFYNIATKVSCRKKCYYFWWSTWLQNKASENRKSSWHLNGHNPVNLWSIKMKNCNIWHTCTYGHVAMATNTPFHLLYVGLGGVNKHYGWLHPWVDYIIGAVTKGHFADDALHTTISTPFYSMRNIVLCSFDFY